MMPKNYGFKPEWWERLRLFIALDIAGDDEFSCGNARFLSEILH